MLKYFILILTATIICSCNQSNVTGKKKLNIVASIYPEYAWLKKIIGDNDSLINVSLIIKSGVDLHSYAPTATDIATISESNAIVYIGGESDKWIKKALNAAPKKDRIEINLLNELGSRVKTEEIVEGMQSVDDVDSDEHIWLSLKNAHYLVQKLAQIISKLDTLHAKKYQNNANAYISKIDSLDAEYETVINNSKRRILLFGDRFPFRYLVDDYGLEYYAAFAGCSAESEASFKTVAFLASKMDSENLPAILTIEHSNQNVAKAILRASKKSNNAKILTLNSMQSANETDDYLSIMRKNLEILKIALR